MGFSSQRSRARTTRVLSGLNSVDTDWSAFNVYGIYCRAHSARHVRLQDLESLAKLL